ncbi:MAG: RHS repeat-associated core domain-containing protein, partial [Vicinamibacterales bacterium]
RLNRTTTVAAAYFDRPFHPIAAYSYVGPDRLKTKMLGNGAALTRTFDGKRRLQTHEWTGSHVLLRFAYAYDRMDNCLLERFEHEPGACDYFAYNNRYEIVDVRYERGGSPAGREVFCYDDVFNRRQAYSEDPAAVGFPRIDTYFANQANEYVQLLRNGRRYDLTHDEAGNATRLPLRDPLATGRGPDRLASAQWDASNCLFTLQADAVGQRGFRYDAFRRRIASFVLRDGKPAEGRRYLYDRWWVVEERLFDRNAAHTDAPGHLERVYVHGQLPDEHLLTAIDADQDGRLVLDSTCTADSPVDQEYYLLCNRLGSIMALLHADDADRVIERYSYSVYGEPRMPVESPPDGRRARSAPSPAGNPCFFAGQRLDGDTGLYYCRNRYYDARAGRFLSRDYYRPHGAPNLYQYVGSNPVNFTDPFGLFRWNGFFMFTEWDFVFDNDIAWIDFTIDFECDPTTGTISAVLPRVDPYAAETFGGKVVDSDIVWAPATACCINVIYGVTVVYDKSYAAAGAALGGGIGLVLGSALGPGGTVAGGATGATIGTALGTLLGWIASDEEKGGIVSRPFSICCCPNGSKSAWQTVGDARNGVYRTSDDDWYVSGYVLAADCSKQSIGAARIFWRSWQHPNEPKFPPYLFRY